MALLAFLCSCACGDQEQTRVGGAGAENHSYRTEPSGFEVNMLWVLDARALQMNQEALRSKLFALAETFPLPETRRGRHAVILARAGELGNQGGAGICPAPHELWSYSQVCGESTDALKLQQFLRCALDGATAHRTALPPLSALASFLQGGFETNAVQAFKDPITPLHIVIVSDVDDDGLEPITEITKAVSESRGAGPGPALVTVIGPATATTEDGEVPNRLAAFTKALGAQSKYIDMQNESWSLSYDLLRAETCLYGESLDTLTDPVRRKDCLVEERLTHPDSHGTVVPSCATHRTSPCWFVKNSQGCASVSIFRGNCLPPDNAVIHIVCSQLLQSTPAQEMPDARHNTFLNHVVHRPPRSG